MSRFSKFLNGTALAVALAATVLMAKPAGQAVAVLFGNASGVAVPWAVDSSGNLNVSVQSGLSTIGAFSTLYYERPNLANTTTDYVTTTAYSVAANTLNSTGDTLHVELIVSTATGTSTRTFQCNIGYTAFSAVTGFTGGQTFLDNTHAVASNMVIASAFMTRTGAAAEDWWALNQASNGSASATVWASGSAVDWTAANNLLCAVKDGTGTAGLVTLRQVRVFSEPGP